MIKQIGAKKIEFVLSKNLKKIVFSILQTIKPISSNSSPLKLVPTQMKKSLLPPIENKGLVLGKEASVDVQSVLPAAEKGFLLMGDVVTLVSIESQDIPSSSGVITGDGIAHNFLDCIPTTSFVNSQKIHWKLGWQV